MQAENPESEMVAWLTSGKAKNFSESDYRLSGIMGAWHNAKALKDNHYNPAPQMPELTASMIFNRILDWFCLIKSHLMFIIKP